MRKKRNFLKETSKNIGFLQASFADETSFIPKNAKQIRQDFGRCP